MDEFTSARIKPYIIDANEALEFKLVRSVKDVEDDEVCFKPDMSHQVFGEKSVIQFLQTLSSLFVQFFSFLQNLYCQL